MVRIGAHFHVDHPLDEAIARGADAAQFFLGDPQGWKGPVIPGGAGRRPGASPRRASTSTSTRRT